MKIIPLILLKTTTKNSNQALEKSCYVHRDSQLNTVEKPHKIAILLVLKREFFDGTSIS